jgi:hypothetical protein
MSDAISPIDDVRFSIAVLNEATALAQRQQFSRLTDRHLRTLAVYDLAGAQQLLQQREAARAQALEPPPPPPPPPAAVVRGISKATLTKTLEHYTDALARVIADVVKEQRAQIAALQFTAEQQRQLIERLEARLLELEAGAAVTADAR